MSTLEIKFDPLALSVSCTEEMLHVVLADGRELSAPLAWFPRLQKATPKQRQQWRLIGGGVGIHWESVDEDISVESLLSIKQISISTKKAEAELTPAFAVSHRNTQNNPIPLFIKGC